MGSERWQRIKAIFDRALEAPAPERDALLEQACAGDAELRREIESLLASYDASTGFMDAPAVTHADARSAGEPPLLPAAARIGPYRLIEPLGQGGMGAVYLAERADGQFEQRVAIKLVRAGLGSGEILRRFEAERRILATLEHPNIARLYDGGVTGDGVPYIVMEHVEGTAIDAYCDALRLDIGARIEVFRTVCSAVRYAHRNLVVHRDIKPSNILVAQDGTAKLLDFGVAKLLDSAAAETQQPMTRTGMRVMTPEYASPEQVRGEPVTTASDVYALGILLYELLTGERPYLVPAGPPSEIERAICEAEPPRPSLVAAAMMTVPAPGAADGASRRCTPAAASRARATDPARLGRRLAGDLDTITLKALQKAPERRYASVAELSEDLRRHLAGLPVVARPDTFAYLASKFVRRHRAGVVAGAAVLAALAAGLAGTAWQAHVAASERDRARQETLKAERTNTFLREMLASPDPNRDGRTVTVVEILDSAAQRVDAEFADQPEVAAALHATLANTYRGLGQYDDAEPQARAALELRRRHAAAEPHRVAASWHELGRLLYEEGSYDEAASSLRSAVALYRRSPAADSLDLAEGLDALAVVLNNAGQDDEAERLYGEALGLYRRHLPASDLRVARVLNNLAVVLGNREQFAEAEPLHREALRIMRDHYGGDHPEVASTLYNLGGVLDAQGRHQAARACFAEALAMRRKLLGAEHPHVILTMISLANTLRSMGDDAGAEQQARAALELARQRLAAGHPVTAYAHLVLGQTLYDAGQPAAAEPHLREALRMRKQALPPGHWLVANTESVLGGCLAALQRYEEAETLLLDALAKLEADRGPGHEKTLDTLRRLVDLYSRWGKPARAARYREQLEAARSPSRTSAR